jgi:SulP family sulfate permease
MSIAIVDTLHCGDGNPPDKHSTAQDHHDRAHARHAGFRSPLHRRPPRAEGAAAMNDAGTQALEWQAGDAEAGARVAVESPSSSAVPTGRRTAAQRWRGVLAGGVTTALVQMPFDAIYGLIAFAPLGAQYAPRALAGALVGTVAAHVVATLAGSRKLVLGPRPATTLLVAGLVAALLANPVLHGADGSPNVPLVLSLVALGIAMSGVAQIVFGLLKLGTLTAYMPYPVRSGFMNGVGVLLLIGGVSLMAGRSYDAMTSGPAVLVFPPQWGAVVVGLMTILATIRPPVLGRFALPGPLAGMFAGIATYQLLAHFAPGLALGASMDAVATPRVYVSIFHGWARFAAEPSLHALAGVLLGFALAIALIATMDVLMVASAMDRTAKSRRNPNRELIAQGLSNIAAALVGGQPSAPAIGRSMVNFHAGGRTQASIWVYAATVAATVGFAPGLLRYIPMSAVGGALIVVGFQMIDDWTRRVPGQLLSRKGPALLDRRQRRTLIENYAVMLLVAGTTIIQGVAEAVLVGAIASMVLFVRSNSRSLIRQIVRGDVRRSIKVRTPPATQFLDANGHRIALVELEGTIFFGTADDLAASMRRLTEDADIVIFGMRRVTDVDSSGARILLESAGDLQLSGKWLVIADLPRRDPRRQILHAMEGKRSVPGMRFDTDVDQALQWAEDRLLERAGIEHARDVPLALGETELAQGLAPPELDWLAAHFTTTHWKAGDYLFRSGDPGDAIFVGTRGDIAIMLPGANGKRLASIAPGVAVGEMSLLEGEPRSADARAETDLTALMLARASFERIAADRPEVAAKLMRNFARLLSARLRRTTLELSTALEP